MTAESATLAKVQRSRDKQKTRQNLQFAMLKIENSGRKMSISAVAREVGVDASLLHNTYPDIAEQIREKMGRGVRTQRNKKIADLAKARVTVRALRQQLEVLEADLAKLASRNLTLEQDAVVLKAVSRDNGTVRRI